MSSSSQNPKIRPVEVLPGESQQGQMLIVRDPSGLADATLSVSPAVVFLLLLMDGQHSLADIEWTFAERFGKPLPPGQLERMVADLDAAHFLESEQFAAFLQSKDDEYRAAPVRASGSSTLFGADGEGPGPLLQQMLAQCQVSSVGLPGRRLAGLIAPHLDYPRGTPCYADAYGLLATAAPARRFVILGTNHFGRSASVVATSKDFQTPLGWTPTDRAFIHALEARCGADLCRQEFDHAREHSVELQVLILQHVLGPANFEIVPILCPDPCGPGGTASGDGPGLDLRAFGGALGELIRADPTPTVVIAGADLSHVGQQFGDECRLDDAFLNLVERRDRQALEAVVAGRRDAFLEALTRRNNDTRVCSAGAIYVLMAAVPDAQPELLRYHQAVHRPAGVCVTCAAVAFWA